MLLLGQRAARYPCQDGDSDGNVCVHIKVGLACTLLEAARTHTNTVPCVHSSLTLRRPPCSHPAQSNLALLPAPFFNVSLHYSYGRVVEGPPGGSDCQRLPRILYDLRAGQQQPRPQPRPAATAQHAHAGQRPGTPATGACERQPCSNGPQQVRRTVIQQRSCKYSVLRAWCCVNPLATDSVGSMVHRAVMWLLFRAH